ncbi:MAG: FhaA domain-containing protein [Anaerolineales bacterium]|jgi:hypothetical protein
MPSIDEFETRLQSLLEVHLLKHLPGYNVEDGIAQQLTASMHAQLKEGNGTTQAPNIYVIAGNPSTLARWHVKPRLLKELANALYTAGKEAGFLFSSKPVVTTSEDPAVPARELRIFASFSSESIGETVGSSSETKSSPDARENPGNAFLIIGGTQVVTLNQSVINIGRRLDNHVIIDDPRVSRAHAQLRMVKGRFVLFDLNSSGGTFVNGERIVQSVLYPGDVISLAGVNLIFGQDLQSSSTIKEGQTEPGSTISSKQPTALFEKEEDNEK